MSTFSYWNKTWIKRICVSLSFSIRSNKIKQKEWVSEHHCWLSSLIQWLFICVQAGKNWKWKRKRSKRCQSYHVNTWNEKKMFISRCRSLSKCFSMVQTDFYGCYFVDYISSQREQQQEVDEKFKKRCFVRGDKGATWISF